MKPGVIAAGVVAILVLIGAFMALGRNSTSPAPNDSEQVAASSSEPAIISVDGSSTVYPITEAVAEEFQKQALEETKVTVGISGTGGGFKKFCNNEIDISDASRPIKLTEVTACEQANIGYIELPIAYDGLAVVVNAANTWVDYLTTDELKKIWEPAAQGKITHWNQIRSNWPNEEIHLYGAGVDSGTFDYFTEAIVGKEDSSRGDFTSSEDDNVLVQGVKNDRVALGFFGVAYYEQNRDALKIVPIDDGNEANGVGPITPDYQNILEARYQPLSRPLFIYVAQTAAAKPVVAQFVEYYLQHAPELVKEVGYVALTPRAYELVRQRFAAKTPGSLFTGGSQVGVKLEELLGK